HCEKRGIPLEVKDITGIGKRIRYLLLKRILRTPVLEISLKKEKFKLNPSYPFDSRSYTEFLKKVITN
ncbi:MAG: hypothetical protein ACFE9L_19640, partial [Candidatus Hodarchaeota archaeon]